jgi:hypothetical protein
MFLQQRKQHYDITNKQGYVVLPSSINGSNIRTIRIGNASDPIIGSAFTSLTSHPFTLLE